MILSHNVHGFVISHLMLQRKQSLNLDAHLFNVYFNMDAVQFKKYFVQSSSLQVSFEMHVFLKDPLYFRSK